jgi:uncharacterized protein YbaR (Trm112 family)
MIWLKQCPRCRGDLVLDSDRYGMYVYCLQCGHQINELEERDLMATGSVRKGMPVRLMDEEAAAHAA